MATSDFKINPAYLTDEQLKYELRISELTAKDVRESKVKVLTRAIEKDMPVVPDPNFQLDEEIKIIEGTLEAITTGIIELEGNDYEQISRIETQVAYVLARIDRVPSDESNRAKVAELKRTGKGTCLELEADFLEKVSKNDVSYSSFVNSLTSRTIPANPGARVYKWGVQFDGKSDLLSFLEKVRDLTVARGVTEEEVFRSAYDLFAEPALTWYRSIRDSVHNWRSLEALLKKTFLPSEYDDQLWDSLKARYQRKDESTALFVADMTNTFKRLSTVPSKADQLKLIKKNLRPHYISALALQKINTVDDLIALTGQIDEASYAAKRQSQAETKAAVAAEKAAPSPKSEVPKKPMGCWNCGSVDHMARECKGDKKELFCYRCGRKGTTINTCPTCQKNGKAE